MLVAMVADNDLDCLPSLLGSRLFFSADADQLLFVGRTVQELLRGFDYLASPRFQQSVDGKSSAVAAMKRKLESDPVRRKRHYEHFILALADLPHSDECYSLVPLPGHSRLDQIRSSLSLLSNPAQ
jgi:hypothetical protein